jgi:mannose-6-phosphate isomerase-like protein (cupin superfamily)
MTPLIQSKIHTKGWGHEEWIVNNDLYCGKILHFQNGKRCSYHFHKLKTETFYLQSGMMKILFALTDDIGAADELILSPGQTFHVPIGLRHQMIALEESDLFEFSTQHLEEDSYRVVRGD